MLCSLGSTYIDTALGGDSAGYRYESIMYFIFAISLTFAATSTIRGMLPGKNNKVNENSLYCIR
ncbi:hypothetical protein FACS1894166_06780 [Bacilli bacterium]|nr:hypothetical protein FACS1894166_06780 [Bacilli bacterium]